MPVGPSHRRGGGSRSSSRSSSSRSSSSRSYSSSRSRSYSSSRNYSSGHRHYHYYDGDYYSGDGITISPRGWAIFGIVIGFMVVLACLCAGIGILANNVPYHITMRKDAPQYQEIIERAHRGEDGYYEKYITDIKWSGSGSSGGEPTYYRLSSDNGTPYDHNDNTYIEAYSEVVKDGVNYYWLEISFWSEEVNERISCITYSQYPEAAVAGLSSIRLAYTKEYDNDGSWDVINYSYNLSNNADYWYTGKQITTGAILLVVALGVGALMVWCCTLVHKAGKKSTSTTQATSTQTTQEPSLLTKLFGEQTPGEQSSITQFKVCSYCGAHAKMDDDSCNSCGSKKFRKAKDSDLA